MSSEIPDAIGWAYGGRLSILVECKVSRSDFRADQKKLFRRKTHLGMGTHRYYMAPTGIIPLDDVPEMWGLLEYGERGNITVVRVAPEHRERCTAHETAMLWSALRRVQNLESLIGLSGYLEVPSEEHF